MKILIIGGTRFVGRHLVDSARARGHSVTLFNRGKSNPALFADLQTVRGDRETDLALLAGSRWDAVIDTCGYFPRIVGLSAEALRESVGQYVFISSISVYSDNATIGVDENGAVSKIEDETLEQITNESYGALKFLCEQVVQRAYGDHALVIRPGLIVGPNDISDRFTYWPVRVARGGDVLAPDRPSAPTQLIDVRDLADFIIHMIEQKTGGVFNATGPDYELTMGSLLDTCKQVSGSNANFRWASLEFLEQNKVEPWSELPAWVPDVGESAGFSRLSVARALRTGLTFRPLAETVKDTLAWATTLPADYVLKAGLKPEREAELLKLLKEG
jgi:2'-hydroxyisoflavone reductase